MIKKITEKDEAKKCDELLQKLILDEKKYNKNIDENFKVENYFENVIQNEQNILLAYFDDENESKLAGYIFVKQIKDDNTLGYLFDGLYVEKDYRQKGIAQNLIDSALELLEDKDISFVNVNVMYENEVARRIYNSAGFKNFSLTMRKELK